MKVIMLGRVQFSTILFLLAICISLQMPVSAYTFGSGVFGANVPFSGTTTISLSIDKNPTILTTFSNGLFTGSDSHTVTVLSTDIAGYTLYIEDQETTDMSNGTYTIPTSSNSVPAPLAVNTWGFNTTLSSTNFARMPTNQMPIKSTDGLGPTTNGDNNSNGDGITVTYGVKLDLTKASGTYTTGVTYTAIGKS